jgi:hypothetical protein
MRSNIKRYTRLQSEIKYVLSFNEIEKSSNNKTRHIAYNKIVCKDLGKKYMESNNLIKWNSGKSESNYSEIKN